MVHIKRVTIILEEFFHFTFIMPLWKKQNLSNNFSLPAMKIYNE